MPTKGWFESQAAYDARQEAELDKGIKNGTVGRVINDRADQIAVVKYRQEQAIKQKAKQAEVEVLKTRKEMAKEFQRHQEVEAKTQPEFAPEKMSAVQKRLSMWQPKRFRPVDAATQTLEDTRSLRSK